MARILVNYGVKSEGTVEIDTSPFVIGRGSAASLRLDNPLVSREHCAISSGASGFVLKDLGSGSGTQLNGKPVTGAVVLQDGDKVYVGKHTLTFEAASFQAVPSASVTEPDDASASNFWTSGIEGEAATPSPAQPVSRAPAADANQAFARTMLASPAEMQKLRAQLDVTQRTHLTVFEGSRKSTIPLERTPVRFGYTDASDYRIPRKRWFVKLGIVVEPASGTAFQVRQESSWAKARIGGQPLKGSATLRPGDQIEIDGLKIRYSRGDVS